MAEVNGTAAHPRLKRELILAGAALAFGLLVLPALVYWVGIVVLGPYPGGGLGQFYGALLRDLGSGAGRAWVLVAGPYVSLLLLRFALLSGRRRDPSASSRKIAA